MTETQPRPSKAARLSKAQPKPIIIGNILVQLIGEDDSKVGPELDLPNSVTPQQLNSLVNQLQNNEETLPYSFHIADKEITENLGEHLTKNEISVETAVRIMCRPQAVFRVRPVSRCSASMPGHSEAVLSVNFSPDGLKLASGSGDSTVRFWDLNTSTAQYTGMIHTHWVLAVAWSPDSRYLASGDKDGVIVVWDTLKEIQAKGKCLGHKKFISSISWQPAHKEWPSRKFVSGSADRTVRVWDAITMTSLFVFGSHTNTISVVRWGGEGFIYSGAKDSLINVWSAEQGKLVRDLKGHAGWVNGLTLSTDFALRTGPYSLDIKTKNNNQGKNQQEVAQQKYSALTKNSERLVSCSDDNTMIIWNPMKDRKPIKRMTGHVKLINQVCFSPDGRWLVSASFDKAVKLWDGFTGDYLHTFRGHVGEVYQVCWSPDSRLLVSASKDSTLKVWEMRTRKQLVELPGHADEVYCVDWSPAGALVCSGGKDRILKIWRH
eukprot:TRINITY_DN10422_c0_g1_i1.p1 TRINITY_DN10422_c0_g1~~TRINITY_DN10422_c0_g1_i1.p1  ORF type:complete len:491 (+),score=52.19 TRINITY_DN10422_c0_g1_i1:87-1559(+)